MSDNNNNNENKQKQDQEQNQPPLALPDTSTASSESGAPKLDLSKDGGSVKLDHLGPMVVNTDGTMSRIANWELMTEMEKQKTMRVLGKRNKQRLEALEAKSAAEGESGGGQ